MFQRRYPSLIFSIELKYEFDLLLPDLTLLIHSYKQTTITKNIKCHGKIWHPDNFSEPPADTISRWTWWYNVVSAARRSPFLSTREQVRGWKIHPHPVAIFTVDWYIKTRVRNLSDLFMWVRVDSKRVCWSSKLVGSGLSSYYCLGVIRKTVDRKGISRNFASYQHDARCKFAVGVYDSLRSDTPKDDGRITHGLRSLFTMVVTHRKASYTIGVYS